RRFPRRIVWYSHSDQERRRGLWPDDAPGNLLNASKVLTPARRRGRSGSRSASSTALHPSLWRGVLFSAPAGAVLPPDPDASLTRGDRVRDPTKPLSLTAFPASNLQGARRGERHE